jgi:hypothetical protein
MPPFVGTILRMAGRGGILKDDFNRTLAGNLGAMSQGGFAWNVVTGTWDVNGSRPVTATSLASNPLATVDSPVADFESLLTLGAGDAMYFRVQDATNWWRVLWEGYQTSACQQCCSTCCSTCCNTCSNYYNFCNVNSQCEGCGGCTCSCSQFQSQVGYTVRCDTSGTACSYTCNCYSCNCVSCNCTSCNCVYSDNWRMKLQKMVAGVLTTVTTGPVQASATTRAKVALSGDNISAYFGSTLLSSSAQADLAGKKKVGIGLGASNYNTSAMDDFQLSWN